MTDDQNNNNEAKKGLPNSFLVFLLSALFVVFFLQNFSNAQLAKEPPNKYQLEHLINLQLLKPEMSKKIALNDNLVDFSGEFREKETEEGKKRFKYLELLASHHKLAQEQSEIKEELDLYKERSAEAADWFLHLRGQGLEKEGYTVVDSSWDKHNSSASIVLKQLSERNVRSVPEVRALYEKATESGSSQDLKRCAEATEELLADFQSRILGIGSEPLKSQLRSLSVKMESAKGIDAEQQLVSYGRVIQGLESIVVSIDKEHQNIRLKKLRSVRHYADKLQRAQTLAVSLDSNTAQLNKAFKKVSDVVWFFNDEEMSSRKLEQQDAEQYAKWFQAAKTEWEFFALNKGAYFRVPGESRNVVLEKHFQSEEPAPDYMNYLFTFLPVILVVLLLYFLFARQMKGMGGGAMNFGKSPAKLLNKSENPITFKDVAGIDEATEELEEIVEFLKNPSKFTALGGRIPKGVLCVGPPGTGKTLIAKAVAGEAERPFFSISGSDFVEMFVGVGASRIRDMFEQAKKNAPCIIFMDEIDAVGRHRGAGVGGGHDEREQTLNQLLVEMDGFDSKDGVILVAATNRPDVLDKALLRPGRFDRRIVLNLPDIKGRYEILKLHAEKIKMDESVDLMEIARGTPGSSGADLENLLNEAALLAARKNRSCVTVEETREARDKVRYGKERRSMEMDDHEKRHTAYHESGHAIVGMCVEHSEPIEKVTIIPRGMSLGSTHYLPKKNRVSYWKREILDQIAILMGGRIAEDIYVGDLSSGAQNDIERATQLARNMVCEWGMTPAMGPVMYDEREDGGQYLGLTVHKSKKYSEATAKAIDDEVRRVLEEANDRARKILEDEKEKVELMTNMLMEFETLDDVDVKAIMDGTWSLEDKQKRLKEMDEKHKKPTPPPPPKEMMESGEQKLGEGPVKQDLAEES